MGLARRLKRAAAKQAYAKFSQEWKTVKAERELQSVINVSSDEDGSEVVQERDPTVQRLGRRPPFGNWFKVIGRNIAQAAATPQEVKDFVEEVPDLAWEEPTEKKE